MFSSHLQRNYRIFQILHKVKLFLHTHTHTHTHILIVLFQKRNSKIIVLKIFWMVCINLAKIYSSELILIYTNIWWRSRNIFRSLNLYSRYTFNINLSITLQKKEKLYYYILTTIFSSSNLKNLLVYLNSCQLLSV